MGLRGEEESWLAFGERVGERERESRARVSGFKDEEFLVCSSHWRRYPAKQKSTLSLSRWQSWAVLD